MGRGKKSVLESIAEPERNCEPKCCFDCFCHRELSNQTGPCHHTRNKLVLKPSAHSRSPATLQSLCLAFLSLEDGFRRLSAHRLDGEGWKEKCSGPIGGPAAKSSSAAALKGWRKVSAMVAGGLCPGSFVWSAAGVRSPVQCKQTYQIDLCPVAGLSPLPQARPDTSRARSLHSSIPPPQIIDPLSGDYTHCHGGINRRHPRSSDTHKRHVSSHTHTPQ